MHCVSMSCRTKPKDLSGDAPYALTVPSSTVAITRAWITAGPTTRSSTSARRRSRRTHSDALIEHTPARSGPFPEWRSTVRAYYDQMDRIARAVMLSVGRSSGFDDAAIAERLRGANSTLRLINYPARPKGAVPADTALSAEGQALSARRHTDQSGLSLLWQAQPGLQAEAPSGDWYDVPLVDGGISVHLGDMMGTLTRGAARPTPHRVLSRHTPRQSIGFFLEPALSAPLTPADVPVDETTVRDTYAWALLAKLSTYPQYKGLFQSPGECGSYRHQRCARHGI